MSIGLGNMKVMGSLYKRGFSELMRWIVTGGEKGETILLNLACRELGL